MSALQHAMAGFLVDLDGVLIRSHDAHLAAYEAAFRDHGIPVPEGLRRAVLDGMDRASVLSLADTPASLRDSMAQVKEVRFRALVESGAIEAMPGAEAFLRTLREEGRPAVVVSNSATAPLCVSAMGWGWAFRGVIGGTDVEQGKPDPAPFRAGAELLGLPARRCVAVEDSPAGARAARLAGALLIGIGSKLDPSEVDIWAAGLPELPLRHWLRGELEIPDEETA